MERLTRNSIPGILCGIVILFLTGLPGSLFQTEKPIVGLDKVAHVLMYAGFAFACIWGYRKQYIAGDKTYRKRALLLTLLISVAFGGLTELMQETITILHRSGDWRDLIADTIGTILGTTIFYLFFRNKK